MKKQKAAEPESEAPDAAPKKKKGFPLLILAAVALCAAAGAGVYFLLPAAAPKGPDAQHAGGDKKNKQENPGDHEADAAPKPADSPAFGSFEFAGEVAYYLPKPLVVSLEPQSGSRHLKVALAIETTRDSEQAFADKAMPIRDALTTYLRAVDTASLHNPAYMSDLKRQIRRRVEFVVAPAPVADILILDFILT